MRKLHATKQPSFLDRAHRLDIALALSDRELTVGECARQLGLRAATIFRPLREMHDEGLLSADCGEADPTRGTRYRLREDLIEVAERELTLGRPRGRLLGDETIFIVKPARFLDLARTLQDSTLTRPVLWVAELDGGSRFLLALERSSTSTTAHARLRAALESGGAEVEDARTARVLDAGSWRAILAAARDAAA